VGGNNRTVLMDSTMLAPLRFLETSTGQWSPDSHFLPDPPMRAKREKVQETAEAG
jgi:hypothetical protein